MRKQTTGLKGKISMCKNFWKVIIAVLTMAALGSCGQVGKGDSSETEPIFTSGVSYTKRSVHTTKTATFAVGDIDADDGDADGNYTTTTTVTGTLENDQLFSDDVDEDIRATQRTVAKTYYSLPEHNGTTAPAVTVSAEKTTTTANGTIAIEDPSARATRRSSAVTTTSFASDKMFEMKPDMRYDSGRKYTVTSDTTYLNLRYGPSKDYDIKTTIPDGYSVLGIGETVGPDGNVWVYTSYNGTFGWVMRELLGY